MTLFDPDLLDDLGVPHPAPACGERGPNDSWLSPNRMATARPSRPRCNRPPGHGGDHQKFHRDGAILAAWS